MLIPQFFKQTDFSQINMPKPETLRSRFSQDAMTETLWIQGVLEIDRRQG